MPTIRTELAVAELDGKFYVAGGFGGTSAFEAYDPATDSWSQLRALPMGREHPSLAASAMRVTPSAAERASFDSGAFAATQTRSAS